MRLLESEGGRPVMTGRPGGTTASVAFHAALIAMAVVGTMRGEAVRIIEPGERVTPPVYHAPPDAPTTARHGGPTTGAPAAPGTREIPVPTTVPGQVPPVVLTVDIPGASGDPVILGHGAGTLGGFGGGATGGPDASGAWDANVVEVAVLPDPKNPAPAYPDAMRAAGLAGRVVAEFVVDSTGRVLPASVQVIESSHPLFAASVRRTVPALRFTPARAQGHRVAQRVRMPFEFEVR